MISLDPLYQNLRDDPAVEIHWIKLVLALLSLGWREQLFQLCQVRQDQFSDGPHLLFKALSHATSQKQKRRIFQMSNSAPQGTPLTIVFDYYAGCLSLLEDDYQRGFALLGRAAAVAQQYKDLFNADEYLSNIIIQNFLIKPPKDVNATDLSWPREGLPAFEWGESAERHKGNIDGPIIMACCNDTYHHRFGQEFIDTLTPEGHIHIHVANASPEMRAQLEKDAVDKRLSYSYEDSGSLGIGHYYAVMRFLNARSIMEYFNSDLVILDIDCEGISDFPDLIKMSQAYDVTYFRTGEYMPWLDHHAAYIYLTNSPGGQAYSERLRAYIAAKLEKACWMLDQSSMCSLYNFYLSNGSMDGETPVNLHAFKRSEGHDFWKYFTPSGTPEEKWEYRFQKNEP